jgi:hypothetical protein
MLSLVSPLQFSAGDAQGRIFFVERYEALVRK